jgi:hypothetical protein
VNFKAAKTISIALEGHGLSLILWLPDLLP